MECGICFEQYKDKVYLCDTGHSLCADCLTMMKSKVCHCGVSLEGDLKRNYAVEDFIAGRRIKALSNEKRLAAASAAAASAAASAAAFAAASTTATASAAIDTTPAAAAKKKQERQKRGAIALPVPAVAGLLPRFALAAAALLLLVLLLFSSSPSTSCAEPPPPSTAFASASASAPASSAVPSTLPYASPSDFLAASKKWRLEEQEGALGDDHEENGRRGLVTGRELFLGRDHPETLAAVDTLGKLLHARGKLSLAEPFLRRAFEGFERTLGRDHPSTLASAINLRALLKAMEKEK